MNKKEQEIIDYVQCLNVQNWQRLLQAMQQARLTPGFHPCKCGNVYTSQHALNGHSPHCKWIEQ